VGGAREMKRLQRLSIAGNIGLVMGYAAILVRDIASPDILAATDFTVFWGAWWLVVRGRAAALYDEATQRATQKLLMDGGYFQGGLMSFLNPPHFALATAPFGWLADRSGEQAAFIAWTLCNVALLAWFVRGLCDEWGPARQHRIVLTMAVVGFYPVFVTIKNGQLLILLALAILGVYRAALQSRPWAAGAWLAVLTIKPQLVQIVAIYLATRRQWRALAAGAVFGSDVVLVTAAALGPGVWIEYLRRVHDLEQFWGTGTPDYMLNARGALTRVFGLGRQAAIDRVAYVAWVAGLGGAAAMLWRSRDAADSRTSFAFAIGLGLFTNPHLFIHDTMLWIVPLVLAAASMRDAGDEWEPFTVFALAWPVIFLVAGRLDIRSGPLTIVDLHTWTFVCAAVVIGRAAIRRRAVQPSGRRGLPIAPADTTPPVPPPARLPRWPRTQPDLPA